VKFFKHQVLGAALESVAKAAAAVKMHVLVMLHAFGGGEHGEPHRVGMKHGFVAEPE
jgi:hypothetical protein